MNPIYSRNRYSVMQSLGSDVLILYIFSELICANLGDFMQNASSLTFAKAAGS